MQFLGVTYDVTGVTNPDQPVTPFIGGVTSRLRKTYRNQLCNLVSLVTPKIMALCTWCNPLSKIAYIAFKLIFPIFIAISTV